MNFLLHLSPLAVMAAFLVAIYLYRNWLDNHDDPYIHLHNDSHDNSIINTQAAIHRRLETVDKVKTGLLVATIVYALAIAGMGVYWAWTNPGS